METLGPGDSSQLRVEVSNTIYSFLFKVWHITIENVNSGQGSVEISGDVNIRCFSIRK